MIQNNLREVREDAGLTQDELAKKIGTSYQNISHWEAFRRDIGTDYLLKISEITGRPIEDILRPPKERPKIPVVGYFEGKEEFYFENTGRTIEMPILRRSDILLQDLQVAVVRKDALRPLIKDEWIIYFARNQEGVPNNCLENLSLVKLKDGRMFGKEITYGSKEGKYTLRSYNNQYDPIKDVKIEWATKIIAFEPPK